MTEKKKYLFLLLQKLFCFFSLLLFPLLPRYKVKDAGLNRQQPCLITVETSPRSACTVRTLPSLDHIQVTQNMPLHILVDDLNAEVGYRWISLNLVLFIEHFLKLTK